MLFCNNAKYLGGIHELLATTDDHAYGSPKSGVWFTDLGTEHTFMMTKHLTGSKKIQMNK